MPGNPFEISYAPDASIDLSLFSHIHNDPFLAGTFQLEGNQFKRTIGYLARYCASLLGDKPPEILALQKSINKLVDIETEMARIRSLPAAPASIGLKSLSEDTATKILETLNEGDYLSMPGGWISSGGGHAMIYQFKRTTAGLEFYIHNAGAGVGYHERQSTTDRELYYPVQAYLIPLPLAKNKLALFLRDLMLPQLPELRATQDQFVNAKLMYEEVLPRISFLNGVLISKAAEAKHAYTAGQLSGTCTQRSLHQMLKENFKTLPEYQRFIYQFKRYALDDYINVQVRKIGLTDLRVQKLIKHAMNTMQRTLNIAGLFSDAYIASERAALQTHREVLKLVTVQQEAVGDKKITEARPETNFITSSIPKTLSPLIMEAAIHTPLEMLPTSVITGEAALLDQLQALCNDCKTLEKSGQFPAIIERLEWVFTHFPLPSSAAEFQRPLDFYKGINAENQAEFYKLISKLQINYSNACEKLGSDVALPRMLVVGLSVVSFIDYVQCQLPLNNVGTGHSLFHQSTSTMLGRFFKGNEFNPYFATNSPALDARLKSINALYPSKASTENLLDYYAGIVDTEPLIKHKLLERYKPPAGELSAAVSEKRVKELYCLIEQFDELKKIDDYQPLIKKFKFQFVIEQCYSRAIGAFWGNRSNIDWKFTLRLSGTKLNAFSLALIMVWADRSRALLKYKYGLSDTVPYRHALDVVSAPLSDNHIQLFPSGSMSIPIEDLTAEKRSLLSERQIGRCEIIEREFFHLRASSQHQIKLTLEYFQRHLPKLTDQATQVYMEANLFEPGLLTAELDKNPDILNQLDRFITSGLEHYAEQGLASQQSLFFIRLAYLINHYAAEYKPDLAYGRLHLLQQQLTTLLLEEEIDPEVKQSLHQYQFLTAMARLKLKPTAISATERNAIIDIALPSCFYMNIKQNPKAFIDAATRFELGCAQHDLGYFVAQSDPLQVGDLVGRALETLGLGRCDGAPLKTGSFYTVKMRQGERQRQYKVDADRCLIFDESGMVYTKLPLDILHHPVMQYLNPKHLETCVASSDGRIFEIGDSELRFIRETPTAKYRVQKKWTVNGYTQWYELHNLSSEQEKAFGLDSQTISVGLPAILKQRDTQIWVGSEDPKTLLITENNCPSYRCITPEGSSFEDYCVVKQLNEMGTENGFTLCFGHTWLHIYFAKFENAGFISVCQNGEVFQVKFGRYGLTLLASREAGKWVYRLQSNPALTLVEDVYPLFTEAAGLVFEDKKTHQRTCYLPLQQFICNDGPSSHSEFHNLQQDIAWNIPTKVVQELAKSKVLKPWQYAGNERVIRYQLDQDGQPRAETVCEALYLCYVYLGTQHPEKAWAVLDDCAKRLGGLKGTVEELSLLNWIINALPRKLKDEDEKATLATPAYVACQLKALALLTETFSPDKKISIPSKTFDLETPDGIYQNNCLQEVQAFHADLNSTLYALYSRFQNMQRHLEHGFCLTDEEKKSLLDYYHFNLPDSPVGGTKALGALGYEWQKLGLKALKKEEEALKAEAIFKGALPLAYQNRLREIERILKLDTTIHAHHTELELLPIDLHIPLGMQIQFFAIKMSPEESTLIVSWLSNIRNASVGAAELKVAVDALTPDITELQLLLNFPCYYQLVLSPTRSEQQDKLVDFCRQYLIAHRHTPLNKQSNKATLFCNILYRIAQCRNKPASEQLTLSCTNCLDIFNKARKLPNPEIKIYQVRNTTSNALAATSDIWAALSTEVLVPSMPIVATSSVPLESVGVVALCNSCGLNVGMREQYKAHAKVFGVPKPAAEVLDESQSQVLSPAELQAGKAQYDALQAMKRLASEMLAQQTLRDALQIKAQEFIEHLGKMQQEQLGGVLRLANSGPADPVKKRCRDLELDSASRAPMDEQRLLTLYFKADKASYALETGLSDEQIVALHTGLSHYLASKTRQQALQRFCKQIRAAGPTPDESTLQQIAHELLTEDLVDYRTEPVLAIMQSYENILLRPQQKGAIKRLLVSPSTDRYSFMESIEKIIMGGGKSKVILPILAQSKATGTNLVVLEVPSALFETNCTDLSDTSIRLFNQKACPFEFNRDSNCSPESLQFLYSKLIDVIVRKDYLVTTGDAVPSLELKYLELLLQRPKDAEEYKLWAKQVGWLDKIVSLFRTRADVVMDEIHNGLLLKKKLNYTLGQQRAVSPNIITECVELYRFFDQVSLDEVLTGKSLVSILENNQLLTQDEQWKTAMVYLTRQLVEHPASPLKLILQRLGPVDKAELLIYLANKGEKIPACVLRSDTRTRIIFALYKEQLNQLLPHTLKLKLNEHYGVSQKRAEDDVSIPYIANNVPSERSRFGNYLEAINFSIQMLMIDGFRPALLKKYLRQLQEQARQELFKEPAFGTMDNTPTAKGFRGWTLDLSFTLSQLRLDDDKQFQIVFSALCKNKELICEVLKTEVLPQIHVEAEILHSDAYNHVDLYRSCQGVTGTPSNSSTYHQRLDYNKKTAAATDGFILNVLKEKHTVIRQVVDASPETLLDELFAGKEARESVRAIIDICATFKGISNFNVAKKLAKFAKEHPERFLLPSPLLYMLFFNEDNVLCALDIVEGNTPIIIGSTDPDVINAKLGCTPDARFTYYDQSHTSGIDLKQARSAKALVLVDHETHLQSFLQGCMRMRGIQDEQSVEIIVPASLDLEALITRMAANEEQQLQKDNFSAAQAKMKNLIRADFMRRLLALSSDDIETKNHYALMFKTYFVEEASLDFFAVYGGLSTECSAKDILEQQRDCLFDDWSKILKSLGEVSGEEEKKRVGEGLDQIIASALPQCQKTYQSPTRQEQGREVEVQQQVQVQVQREIQLEQVFYNPSLEPSIYKQWTGVPLDNDYKVVDGFLSLSALCRLSTPTVPDFGEIYVGPNYYQAYKGQVQFIDVYLKPVHALLFRQRRDGKLECLIVSQKEADELSNILAAKPNPNLWISTTQHTVLAGTAPGGIKENPSYQGMIEKIRFFNGELRSMLEGAEPLNWLSEGTGQKLAFFEQNLLPYRETERQDLVNLGQMLSQRQKAFRYILEHPCEDYTAFEWRVYISEELTGADIEECEKLAGAFSWCVLHWRESDFSSKKSQEGRRLSLQSLSYIDRFAEQLIQLKGDLTTKGILHRDDIKILIDSFLPMLFKDYLPLARSKKQTLLQFVMTRLSVEPNNAALLNCADCLLMFGSDINEVDSDGRSALELVIQGAGDHVLEAVQWLLKKGAKIAVHKDILQQVRPSTIDQLFRLPAFQANEAFIFTYIEALSKNVETYSKFLDTHGDKLTELCLVAIVQSLPGTWIDHKSHLEALALLQRILSHAHAGAILLESAVGYALNFEPLLMERFWSDFMLRRWYLLDANILCRMILVLPEGLVEELFNSAIFIENRECILNKLILSRNSAVVAKLLENKKLGLEIKDLYQSLEALDLRSVQSVLPLVIRYKAVNQDVLQKVIEVMMEPAEELLPVLLANEQFRSNKVLVKQLLEKLGEITRQKVLAELSALYKNQLSAEVLSVVIHSNKGDINHLRQTMNAYGGILNQVHLLEVLRSLVSTEIELVPRRGISELLLQVVKHVNADSAVLDAAAFCALQFEPRVMASFWRDFNSERWDTMDARVLCSLVVMLPVEFSDNLFRSTTFLSYRDNILNKLTQGADVDVYCRLLENKHLKLESVNLILFLTRLDPMHVQAILPQLAAHPAANNDVLQNIVARMTEPTEVLLHILLANNQFKINEGVVDRFAEKANLGLCLVLFQYTQIELQSKHLLMFMTTLDAVQVQTILPQIACHTAANQDVLQRIVEVMNEPAGDLVRALLVNEQFITNVALVKKLLNKMNEVTRREICTQLASKPGLPLDVVNVLIEESKFNVESLLQIFNYHHAKFSSEHLKSLLPKDRQQAKSWFRQASEVSKLLLVILEHREVDASVQKLVMDCALAVLPQDAFFWSAIPKIAVHDLSGSNLARKSDDDLKILFAALRGTVELDLSRSNLGKKDAATLADVFKKLPGSVEKLDLSDNQIDIKFMPKIFAAIPRTVTSIAYEQHTFMPRAEINAKYPDYSFLFNCLAGIAIVAGGVMLIAGLIAMQSLLLAGAGLAVLATLVVSTTLSKCGLFANKPHPEAERPENGLWSDSCYTQAI